jgi:hypothetical protein
MPPTRASQGLKPTKTAFQSNQRQSEHQIQPSPSQNQPQNPSSSNTGSSVFNQVKNTSNMQIASSGKIKPKLDFSFDEKQDQILQQYTEQNENAGEM